MNGISRRRMRAILAWEKANGMSVPRKFFDPLVNDSVALPQLARLTPAKCLSLLEWQVREARMSLWTHPEQRFAKFRAKHFERRHGPGTLFNGADEPVIADSQPEGLG